MRKRRATAELEAAAVRAEQAQKALAPLCVTLQNRGPYSLRWRIRQVLVMVEEVRKLYAQNRQRRSAKIS